jgi:hypothetical protein
MEMTHAEKLILIMLSEIYEHLGIGGADHINARFVRSAIDSNQTWALSRKYPFIFGGRTQTPDVVSEVRDILDMWSYGQETRRMPYRPAGMWTEFLRATTLRGLGDYRDPQS